jgi:hypothetical protein
LRSAQDVYAFDVKQLLRCKQVICRTDAIDPEGDWRLSGTAILPHSAYDQGADAYFLVVGEPQVGRERSNAVDALDPVAFDVRRGKCSNRVRYR